MTKSYATVPGGVKPKARVSEQPRERLDEAVVLGALVDVENRASSIQAVYRYYLEHPDGASTKHVAEALGMPVATVRRANTVLGDMWLLDYVEKRSHEGRKVTWFAVLFNLLNRAPLR